jgi:hypothetical protein
MVAPAPLVAARTGYALAMPDFMVASRCQYRLDLRAAAISFSTSLAVRYSRVRATEEFTMLGAKALSTAKAMKFPIPDLRLRN